MLYFNARFFIFFDKTLKSEFMHLLLQSAEGVVMVHSICVMFSTNGQCQFIVIKKRKM